MPKKKKKIHKVPPGNRAMKKEDGPGRGGVKKYKTADFAVFTNTAKRLKIGFAELAEQLGYNATAYHRWEDTKLFPRVAAIACEGLVRRMGKANGKEEVVIKATDAEVISGNGRVKQIHPGLYVVEL